MSKQISMNIVILNNFQNNNGIFIFNVNQSGEMLLIEGQLEKLFPDFYLSNGTVNTAEVEHLTNKSSEIQEKGKNADNSPKKQCPSDTVVV